MPVTSLIWLHPFNVRLNSLTALAILACGKSGHSTDSEGHDRTHSLAGG
jgi:hypothetical protein